MVFHDYLYDAEMIVNTSLGGDKMCQKNEMKRNYGKRYIATSQV